MLDGQTHHEDFAGHNGTIGPGDLQWMTAGRGIVHSEVPVKLSRDQENERALGLQLWINLPKVHKMCEPQYQELLDAQIPRARPQDGVVIKVIAGDSHGVKSQIYTRTPTIFLDFKMDKNQTVIQIIPTTYNGFIYVLSGPHTSGIRTVRPRQKGIIPSSSLRIVPAPSGSRQRMRQRILY